MKTPQQSNSRADATADEPVTPRMRKLVADAMRRANTYLEAPSVCPRRPCRGSGKCHLVCTAGLELDCGAGVSALTQAIGMIALDLLREVLEPQLPRMEHALRCTELWKEHRHLVVEQRRAMRKADKALYG